MTLCLVLQCSEGDSIITGWAVSDAELSDILRLEAHHECAYSELCLVLHIGCRLCLMSEQVCQTSQLFLLLLVEHDLTLQLTHNLGLRKYRGRFGSLSYERL